MPLKKRARGDGGRAERFRMRLERRLRGNVTLPFSRELWDYRALVEKKKTRRVLRIINAITRQVSAKKLFPYPNVEEEFIKDYEDSDSSYGRDESILSEGYFVVDKIYGGVPGRKIYFCKKSLFSKTWNDDKVAVKVVNLKKALKEYVYDVLPRELGVILSVKHPFIIDTLCVVFRKKEYFIFMRYAEKSDLFDYLLNYGALTESRARIWIAQVAQALEYLHSLEIVHRDICCENILITEHNNLKLTDFENATTVEYDMGKAVPLEGYKGTLEYATPEILAGRPYHAKGADTWALAVVLYSMLTVHLPFSGSTAQQLRRSQHSWQLPNAADFSLELGSLFYKAFQFKSSRRYNLQRFINADWFKKDPRLSVDGKVSLSCRPCKGECRPKDDPHRLRLVKDPAQELTNGAQPIRFQPFMKSVQSTCTLIPALYENEDLGETLSEDLSYGIPFTPGEEHKAYLRELANAWGKKKQSKK